jgi:hypothetical protein
MRGARRGGNDVGSLMEVDVDIGRERTLSSASLAE